MRKITHLLFGALVSLLAVTFTACKTKHRIGFVKDDYKDWSRVNGYLHAFALEKSSEVFVVRPPEVEHWQENPSGLDVFVHHQGVNHSVSGILEKNLVRFLLVPMQGVAAIHYQGSSAKQMALDRLFHKGALVSGKTNFLGDVSMAGSYTYQAEIVVFNSEKNKNTEQFIENADAEKTDDKQGLTLVAIKKNPLLQNQGTELLGAKKTPVLVVYQDAKGNTAYAGSWLQEAGIQIRPALPKGSKIVGLIGVTASIKVTAIEVPPVEIGDILIEKEIFIEKFDDGTVAISKVDEVITHCKDGDKVKIRYLDKYTQTFQEVWGIIDVVAGKIMIPIAPKEMYSGNVVFLINSCDDKVSILPINGLVPDNSKGEAVIIHLDAMQAGAKVIVDKIDNNERNPTIYLIAIENQGDVVLNAVQLSTGGQLSLNGKDFQVESAWQNVKIVIDEKTIFYVKSASGKQQKNYAVQIVYLSASIDFNMLNAKQNTAELNFSKKLQSGSVAMPHQFVVHKVVNTTNPVTAKFEVAKTAKIFKLNPIESDVTSLVQIGTFIEVQDGDLFKVVSASGRTEFYQIKLEIANNEALISKMVLNPFGNADLALQKPEVPNGFDLKFTAIAFDQYYVVEFLEYSKNASITLKYSDNTEQSFDNSNMLKPLAHGSLSLGILPRYIKEIVVQSEDKTKTNTYAVSFEVLSQCFVRNVQLQGLYVQDKDLNNSHVLNFEVQASKTGNATFALEDLPLGITASPKNVALSNAWQNVSFALSGKSSATAKDYVLSIKETLGAWACNASTATLTLQKAIDIPTDIIDPGTKPPVIDPNTGEITGLLFADVLQTGFEIGRLQWIKLYNVDTRIKSYAVKVLSADGATILYQTQINTSAVGMHTHTPYGLFLAPGDYSVEATDEQGYGIKLVLKNLVSPAYQAPVLSTNYDIALDKTKVVLNMQINDQRLKGYSLYKTKDLGTETKIQDISSSGSFAQYTDNIDAIKQATYSYVLKSTNPAGVQSNTVAVSVGTVIAPDFEVKINDATNNPGYTTYKITHKDPSITAYTLTVKKPDNTTTSIDIINQADFGQDLAYGYALPGEHTFTLAVKTQTGALPNFAPIVITKTSPDYQLPVLNAVLVGTNVQIDFAHKDKRIANYKLLRTQPTATFSENIVATSLNIGDNTAKTDDISALSICQDLVYELQMLSDAGKKSSKTIALSKSLIPSNFNVQQGATDVQGSFTTSSSTAEAQYKKISDFAWTALTLTGKQFTKPVKDFELGINNYEFQVRALHAIASCHSDYATKNNVQIKNQEKLPTPVLSLKAKTPNMLEVEWGVIANAVNYTVERMTDALLSNWVNIGTGTTAGNTLQITGLAQNTNYKVRIKAKGDNDKYLDSDYGDLQAKTQDKLPQANLTLVATSSKITASWNVQNNARHYKLEYREQGTAGAWTTIDNIPVATTSKEITTGLVQGKTYEFNLYLIGQVDFADADVQNKTVKVKTPLQTGFSVKDYGLTSITFEINRDANAISYDLTYKDTHSVGNSSLVNILAINCATSPKCTYVLNLSSGKEYHITLIAKANPTSDYENSVTHDLQQHTKIKINVPQNVLATAVPGATDKIKVEWNEPNNFPAWGGFANSMIAKYRVKINSSPTIVVSSVDVLVISPQKTHTFSGLTQGVSYTVSVQALSADEQNALSSDLAYFGTGTGSNIVIPPSNFITAPVANIDDFGLDYITVSWTASNPVATQYQVCYKTGANAYTCTTNASPYKIIGLTANTSYNIYVIAKGGSIGGQIYADLQSNSLTQSTKSKLATPTNLAWATTAPGGASAVSGNLTWTAVANAGSYKITYIRTGGSTATFTALASNGTITYPIINLAPGTYTFTVQALAGVGSNFVDSDPANLNNQVLTLTLNSPVLIGIAQTPATASSNDGKLTLTWNSPAPSTLPTGAVVTYEINYSKEGASQTPITGVSLTSYSISGLEGAKNYVVKIKAVATVNGLTLSSNEVFFNSGSAVTVKKHQVAPTITATPSARTISVNFSSTAITPLALEYSSNGGSTYSPCNCTITSNATTISSLNPNTAYTLRAYASSSSLYEQSLNSTLVTVTTLPEILAPTLTLTPSSESASTEPLATAYKGSITATASATVTGATTVSYEYQYRETGTSNWLPATPSASGVFTTLTGAKQYDVQARTKAVINNTTYYSATWATASVVVKKKLPKPAITLETPNNSSIKVTVTSTKGDETNYEVWYREKTVGSFGKWSGLITATANPREATITPLGAGKTYEVYVVATHTNAPFYDSSDATSATSDRKVLSQLSPPTSINATASSCQYIKLTWTNPASNGANAIGFKARYTTATVTATMPDAAWTVTDLLTGTDGIIFAINPGDAYTVQMKAIGDNINWNDSEWANTATPSGRVLVPPCTPDLPNISVEMILIKKAPKTGTPYTSANAPEVHMLLGYVKPGPAQILFTDKKGKLIYQYSETNVANSLLKEYPAYYYTPRPTSMSYATRNDDGTVNQVWVKLTLVSSSAFKDENTNGKQEEEYIIKQGSTEISMLNNDAKKFFVFTGGNDVLFGTNNIDVVQVLSTKGRVVFADRNAGQTDPDPKPIRANPELFGYNKQVYPFQWGREQDGHHNFYRPLGVASFDFFNKDLIPFTTAPIQANSVGAYTTGTVNSLPNPNDSQPNQNSALALRHQFVTVFDATAVTRQNTNFIGNVNLAPYAEGVTPAQAADPNTGIDWFAVNTGTYSKDIKQTTPGIKAKITSNDNQFWKKAGSTNPCLPSGTKPGKIQWLVPKKVDWQKISLLPTEETFAGNRDMRQLASNYKPTKHFTPILWYFMNQMALTTGGFRRYFMPVRYFDSKGMYNINGVNQLTFGSQFYPKNYLPQVFASAGANPYNAIRSEGINKSDQQMVDVRMAAPFIPFNVMGMRAMERSGGILPGNGANGTNPYTPGQTYNSSTLVDLYTNRKLLAMVQPTNSKQQNEYSPVHVVAASIGAGGNPLGLQATPATTTEPHWDLIPDQVTTSNIWGYYISHIGTQAEGQFSGYANADLQYPVSMSIPEFPGSLSPTSNYEIELTENKPKRIKINQGDPVLRNWAYYWTADVGADTDKDEWRHPGTRIATNNTHTYDLIHDAYKSSLSMPTAYAYAFYLDIINGDDSAGISVTPNTMFTYDGTQAKVPPTKGSRAYLVRKHRLSGLQVRCVLDL